MGSRTFLTIWAIFCAVLLATKPLAAKCNLVVSQGIPQLGADTVLQLPATSTIAAGEDVTLSWQRGRFPDRYPAYLMIAFDGPVRFKGSGFYTLLPTAEAAFGIPLFNDQTRVVIPYYGRGTPRQGTVTVQPLRAGSLNMRWAVVGHDNCREIVANQGNGSATVHVEATGQPEIVVKSFAGELPTARIYSPSGGRLIEVHDGRYRLLDDTSRAEVAERVGQHPRFSPTGRYLVAYVDDGIEMLDSVDGKTIFKSNLGQDVAWDNADSFAIIDKGAWGAVEIIAPILSSPSILSGKGSCHACDGTGSTALRIDLENNVAVFNGNLGVGATNLTNRKTVSFDLVVRANEMRRARQDVMRFVKTQSQVTKFKLPRVWELRGGLKFSNLEIEPYARANPDHKDPLMTFLVEARFEPVNQSAETSSDQVTVTQWRGSATVASSRANRKILKRLAEFGIPVPVDGSKEVDAGFRGELLELGDNQEGGLPLKDVTARMQAVAKRIGHEVSIAKGVFVEATQRGTQCYPHWEGVSHGKIYNRFQRAFRFDNGKRVIWITHFQCREGSAAFSYPSLALFDTKASKAWFLNKEDGSADQTERISSGDRCSANIADCAFNAQIFGERFLLLSSALSRAIEVYDLDARRIAFRKYNLPRGDLLKDAFISPDGKLVVQINSDGSFAGFRRADAKLLFEGRYIDDEVIAWTPEGRFDATSEGSHYVSLRLPGRVGTYTFAQFSEQLRIPGLISRLLADETFATTKLTAPPSLSGRVSVKGNKLSILVEPKSDTRLASLLVFQDGLLTARLNAESKPKEWAFEVDLLPGTRWVSMVATDQSGLASLPVGRDLSKTRPASRRLHLLAIGVDEYQDPKVPDLDFARSDARRFVEAASSIGGDVTIASSSLLFESSSTRQGVLNSIKELTSKAQPGETVMLFFAGHGVRSEDGEYYLATPETQINDISGTALPWQAVSDVLVEQDNRVAVFLDTCHSGEAGKGVFATNDSAAQSLLERLPSGIVVISASKGRELSEEAAEVGGGVFTSALVKVIAGDRTTFDANSNGAIEISELYRGVKNQVQINSNGRQTPWIARNQMVGDFALF